jgi:hypothetical protein
MKMLLICVFVIALFGVIILTSSSETTTSLSPISLTVTNLFSSNAMASLKPKVYQAEPYAITVIVPEPVDTAAMVAPPSTNQFAIRTIERPLHLEPVK